MKRQDKPRATAPAAEGTVPRPNRGDPSLEVVSYAVAALVNAYGEEHDKAKMLPRLTAAAVRVAALAGRDEADEQLAHLARLQKEATRLAAEHLERKKQLSSAAVALAPSTDWKQTRSTLDRLMHEWHLTGWSDDTATAPFRKAFNDAVATFTRRQEQWFDEQRMRGAPVDEYREYLCTRAEQLQGETDDTMWAAASERLKQLAQLWKKMSRHEEDPALSARFTAAEHAFEARRGAWYDANHARKEKLLHHIETLTETTIGLGWEAARREVADIEGHDWREAGQLPRDQHEIMERELRRALAAFHIRQSEAEHEALKQKEKVVVRIQALAERPLDNWKATRAVLLELQQAYMDVGPVAAESEADLLQAYRAACQAVVGKLGTLRGNGTEQRGDVIRLIRELTDKAGKGVSWRDARDKVVVLQKHYMGAGPVAHAEGEGLWQEYRAACDRFFELYRSWTGDNVEVKELLCVEAEALLDERDPFEAKEKAKKLQQRWKYSGPIPPEDNETLWSRFSEAVDKVFDRARAEWEDIHGTGPQL
jgi:predicted component of type VI protein secretion system